MKTVSDMTAASATSDTAPMALEEPDAKHAWLADAELAISTLCTRWHRTGQSFTADDVRAMIGAPQHGNWFGVAFSAAQRRGDIEAVAYGAARAKSRNGGSLKIWKAASP